MAGIARNAGCPQGRPRPGWHWSARFEWEDLFTPTNSFEAEHVTVWSIDQMVVSKRSNRISTVGAVWVANDDFCLPIVHSQQTVPLWYLSKSWIQSNISYYGAVVAAYAEGRPLLIGALYGLVLRGHHLAVVNARRPGSCCIDRSEIVLDIAAFQSALGKGVTCQLKGIKQRTGVGVARVDCLAEFSVLPRMARPADLRSVIILEAA